MGSVQGTGRAGRPGIGFLSERCEKPLKKVADTYTDLFEDMIHLFNGRQVENHYASDISLVLHPLPKVPILICYWKPEDDLESDLNSFSIQKRKRISTLNTSIHWPRDL